MLELLMLCAGCHGMAGEGRAEAGYPRLAGQPAAYLERQLEAYADGRRKSVVMEPLARSLSAQERRRLARELSAKTPPATKGAASLSPRGEALALTGDNALRVQACQNCHGPGGRGQAPFGPALAGLPQAYLRSEMAAWRSDTRRSDPSRQMNVIARQLRDEDVEAVAAYFAALPVTAPAQPAPLPRYARTVPPTLEGVGTGSDEGSDAEGAAATTGGSQGVSGKGR